MLTSKYPLPIRLYNFFFWKRSIRAQALLHKARKKTGLNDLGDAQLEARLERLCQAINKEAKLHAFGIFITKERLKSVLRNRLRAVEYIKQHPSILNEAIKPPIIITGLQRTGTTFLQRLLATLPNNRALLSWEALNPIPLEGENEQQKRIQQALMSQQALQYIAPEFFSIHPVEYDSPEEEILLNDMTLLSAVPEATMDVPSYSQWVAQQDHTVAYEWMLKMLQVLQWKQPPKRWVLKTPQHLEYMQVIAKQLPQAVVIQTHRHPRECIPSFCSMVYHSRRVFSAKVDPVASANHWVNKNAMMLRNMLKVRKDNPQLRVIDVYYQDLVKNPLATIQSIYQQIGLPWEEAMTRAIENASQNNRKNKYGKHQYDMADFGLTEQSIAKTFDFYIQKYQL